jgi:hypothetical protein
MHKKEPASYTDDQQAIDKFEEQMTALAYEPAQAESIKSDEIRYSNEEEYDIYAYKATEIEYGGFEDNPLTIYHFEALTDKELELNNLFVPMPITNEADKHISINSSDLEEPISTGNVIYVVYAKGDHDTILTMHKYITEEGEPFR